MRGVYGGREVVLVGCKTDGRLVEIPGVVGGEEALLPRRERLVGCGIRLLDGAVSSGSGAVKGS